MIEKVNLRDSYKYYKNTTSTPIDVKVYLYIVAGFIKFLVKKVFEGYDVQLSGGRSLGTIAIRGKRTNIRVDEITGEIIGAATDWKATNKLWATDSIAKEQDKRIYHLNEHTNGIRYSFKWFMQGMNVANKNLYFLRFCKPNKRKGAAIFRTGKEYLVTN